MHAAPSRFDLVVTDLNMPGLSGLELARSLALSHPHLAVMLTSGLVTAELRTQAREWVLPRCWRRRTSSKDCRWRYAVRSTSGRRQDRAQRRRAHRQGHACGFLSMAEQSCRSLHSTVQFTLEAVRVIESLGRGARPGQGQSACPAPAIDEPALRNAIAAQTRSRAPVTDHSQGAQRYDAGRYRAQANIRRRRTNVSGLADTDRSTRGGGRHSASGQDRRQWSLGATRPGATHRGSSAPSRHPSVKLDFNLQSMDQGAARTRSPKVARAGRLFDSKTETTGTGRSARPARQLRNAVAFTGAAANRYVVLPARRQPALQVAR